MYVYMYILYVTPELAEFKPELADFCGTCRFELCLAFFFGHFFPRNFDMLGKYKSEIVKNSQK